MNMIATDINTAPAIALAELARLQACGHAIQVCFGAGVDSTAMLCALKSADITPDLILFADTGGEKPETYAHARRMNEYLEAWNFPRVTWVKLNTLETTQYNDLAGNCLDNETLPSLAFGQKSCSNKWKIKPQDYYLKGATRGPNKQPAHELWTRSQETGQKVIKLIGYDSGPADLRRSKNLKSEDPDFLYVYPLQLLGWARQHCVQAIKRAGLPVPIKSACFFCPASKEWEMWWLAGAHPELFEQAIEIERTAMLGKHSRYCVGADGEVLDESGKVVEFGEGWEETCRSADRFPSSNTTIGLGRNKSWFQFALINQIIDPGTHQVRRDSLDFFRDMAEAQRADDNALDYRSCGGFAA